MKKLFDKMAAVRNLRDKNRGLTVVFSVLVLCVTIAVLMLPAIALSNKEVVMDCPLSVHEHSASCYQIDENGNKVLTCGQADYVVHTHDEACYDSEGNLICTLPEIQEHIHDESCYEEQQVLVCDLEENEEHTHTDECYKTEKKLICGKDELHTHNESCFDADGNLICDKIILMSHQHDDECLKEVENTEEENNQDSETSPANKSTDNVKPDDLTPAGDDAPMTWEEFTDKVTVHVEADPGAFPEGTTMRITDIDDEGTIRSVTDAVDGKVRSVKAVDISFIDPEGREIEPAMPIRVSMTSSHKDSKKEDLTIVHVDDGGKAKEVSSVEVDQKKKEVTATFTADEFSVYAVVYTVDFHYEVNGKMYEFSIPGGGFASFYKIVEMLGISNQGTQSGSRDVNAAENSEIEAGNGENTDENAVHNVVEETGVDDNGANSSAISLNNVEVSEATKEFVADVASVEFSSPDLVWVGKADAVTTVGGLKEAKRLECEYSAELTEEKIAEINAQTVEAGDWALISVQPFTSEESLTVTMKNGDQFVVRVTDAQYAASLVSSLDGATGALINKTNNNAVLGNAIDGTTLQAVDVTVNGDQITTSFGSTDLTEWTFTYAGNWSGNDYYQISCDSGYLNLGNRSASISQTAQNLIVVFRQNNGETQIRIANENHDALNNDNNVTVNGYKAYNNWGYTTNPGEWFTVYDISVPRIGDMLDGQSYAIINNRNGGNDWQALRDEIDGINDGRGYYVSGNATTYSRTDNVDYSSFSDIVWNFEYVDSDSSGSCYRISTANGYLYIDPNVTKKSDMPSGQNHNYQRALRLESSPGDGSSSDGTLIKIVPNGDGTYLLQSRNSVSLWNYGNNQFWLSTLTQDGEGDTSKLNSKFRLAKPVESPHVTVHYVDRNGNPLTGVQYTGGNTAVYENADGTFGIPYDISGNVDLRANFDFTSIGEDRQTYTYANTHLDGVDADGNNLKHEGYVIDSILFTENGTLKFKSDSGETNFSISGNPPMGNLAYGTLTTSTLSDRISRRPSNSGSILPYTISTNKDIYVILDPLPVNISAGGNSVNPGDVEVPSLEKTMVSNDDGTYTLSLEVDAHAKSASDTNKANILFVVDTSSSMRNTTTSSSRNRIMDTHDAVLDLGERLLAYNNNHAGAVEVSIITFDGGVNERLDWTTETTEFRSAVNEYLRYYYLHTGTDWEDGMKEALNKLLTDTDDDPTFVVFFTDGEPSQYTNFHGAGTNNNNDPTGTNTSGQEQITGGYPNFYSYFLSRESSKDEMRAIVNAGASLYGIYAYNTTNSSYYSYNGEEDGALMLHNAIKYGYNTTSSLENNLFYEARNTNDLQGAFDKIFNLITESVGFTNVVVKDGIATGVTSSTVVNGDVSGFTYIIRDKTGALAYKVTVAPNGVPEGTTVADGKPLFWFNENGTPVVGEVKSVTATKIKTNENGEPILDANEKIQTEEVSVDVYYYKNPDTNKEYIMPIATTGANVVWDLSPLGILQDGYSYEVNFVVWPRQDAYDLVADLNNGMRRDLENAANWEDKDLLRDSNGNAYRIGGFAEYPYIARYEDSGIYSAMSNTHQSVEYYKADKKIVNGEEITEYTKPDPVTVDPPGPMPLTASMSKIEKQWNVDRNPAVLTELLYGQKDEHGAWVPYSIRFGIFQDASTTEYTSSTLGWQADWDKETDDYEWLDAPETPNVTYAGKPHKVGTQWAQDFSIATGLMLTEGKMEEHGLNKSLYPSFEYNNKTYYVLETGHDYRLEESPKMGYEFDYEAPVYHPMLVDGKLQSVTFSKDGDGKITGITGMTTDEGGISSLKVENTLRGYIHLEKVVVDDDDQTISGDKTKFRYHIKLENTSPVFEGDHIPWYGVNDLYYHDDEFNYYQAYVDEHGALKICTESGGLDNPYDAVVGTIDTDTEEFTQGGTFDPNNVTGQVLQFNDGTDNRIVTIKGNRTEASADMKTAQADMRINQDEKLSIANVPLGTVYTIQEIQNTGYELASIVSNQPTTKDGYTIRGEIVQNADNNVTYTNRLKPGALKLTKIVQIDGKTPTSDQYDLVDGEYTFTVENAEDNDFIITKYVQIYVRNGVAAAYKIADTQAGLSAATEVTGAWAMLTGLAEGDYIVTESEERHGLLLSDVARGDANTEVIDLDNSSVTVHVTAGDTSAGQVSAQATFTNNYYNNDGPDRISLDIVKTFEGLASVADLPDNFRVIVCYSVPGSSDPIQLTLKMNQDETVTAGGEHIKIKETSNGYTLSWHITNIPADASDFKVKETNYSSVTGYTFTSATLDDEDITATAGDWHDMSVVAPTATLSEVTNDRRTSDGGSNVQFILEDGDILLSKLTANQGTLVISKESLNTLERKAVEAGWPEQGGFKKPPRYYSIEEHSSGFQYGGKKVTFSLRESDGKTIVTFDHSASAQEDVFSVSYNSQSALNNAILTNSYIQIKVTLELIKVDSTNMTTPLPEAEFMLHKLDPDGTGTYLSGTDAVEKPFEKTDADGKTSVSGITDGWYEISETKVPAGYVIVDGGKFYIKVVNGTIKRVKKVEDNADTEDINEGLVKNWPETDENSGNIRFVSTTQAVADNPETTEVDESAEVRTTYKVGNTPGAALPNTGGPGTDGFVLLGIMLTGLAGTGLLMRKRRRTA